MSIWIVVIITIVNISYHQSEHYTTHNAPKLQSVLANVNPLLRQITRKCQSHTSTHYF